MPEELQKGNNSERKYDWWVGHIVYCRCGYQARLKTTDKKQVRIVTQCSTKAVFTCPYCGRDAESLPR